jgi:hypothetical protein
MNPSEQQKVSDELAPFPGSVQAHQNISPSSPSTSDSSTLIVDVEAMELQSKIKKKEVDPTPMARQCNCCEQGLQCNCLPFFRVRIVQRLPEKPKEAK